MRGCRSCPTPDWPPTSRAAERAIVTATGVDPRPWFRCPFGAGTDDPAACGRHRAARLPRGRAGTSTEPDWRPSRRGRGMARQMVAATAARGDGAVLSAPSVDHGDQPRSCRRSSTGCGTPARPSCGWTRWREGRPRRRRRELQDGRRAGRRGRLAAGRRTRTDERPTRRSVWTRAWNGWRASSQRPSPRHGSRSGPTSASTRWRAPTRRPTSER